MRLTPKESEIQKAILEYLTLKKIWHMRLNTGAMSGSHKGKRWFVKFGKPGMADILAITEHVSRGKAEGHYVIWIEVKAAGGKQSEAQEEFQADVEIEGQNYLIARSLDDVRNYFG